MEDYFGELMNWGLPFAVSGPGKRTVFKGLAVLFDGLSLNS
jgi:hypothetical protein